MTSRQQSLNNIQDCRNNKLVAYIESAIGVGDRNWQDTKWGDGKIHISLPKDAFTETEIENHITMYERLGWTVTRTKTRIGDDCSNYQLVPELIFE